MKSFIYAAIEVVVPASFNIELSWPQGYLFVFQYYNFITISTLVILGNLCERG